MDVVHYPVQCIDRTSQGTAEEEQQRELVQKQARLMRAEMLKAAKLQPKREKSSGASDGVLLRLLTKVVDRVQITVRNVHLRYEDSISNPKVGAV